MPAKGYEMGNLRSSLYTLTAMDSHHIAQLNDAVLVGFCLRQMEGYISVELLDEVMVSSHSGTGLG